VTPELCASSSFYEFWLYYVKSNELEMATVWGYMGPLLFIKLDLVD